MTRPRSRRGTRAAVRRPVLRSYPGAARLQPRLLKVVVSAWVDSPTLLAAVEGAAIDRYLMKPCSVEELLAAIEPAERTQFMAK